MSDQDQFAINQQDKKVEVLQMLLNKVKPKARYLSQMHVQQFIDSIQREIINGDIQIPEQSEQIQSITDKRNFQTELRQKFISKVQQQKYVLMQKLNYINNSIQSLKKYQPHKHHNHSLKDNQTNSNQIKQRQIAWRKQIIERGKQLQQKKKKVEQLMKKKQQQRLQAQQKVRKQLEEKKKQQIQQNMMKIKQRMNKRQSQVKLGNDKVKQLISHRKKLQRQKIQRSMDNSVQLQQRKKKLAEIRNLHKPIDSKEILDHQQKFFELKKQKEQLRQRQFKMIQSRSKSYKSPYQSIFYKKISAINEQQLGSSKMKMDKMKHFAQHVKSQFAPQIDQKKRRYFEQQRQKEQDKIRKKQQKDRQLLEKPKLKGLQYLQQIRKLPKKRNAHSSSNQGPKTQRTQYANYISHSVNTQHKPWNSILNSEGNKLQKAYKLYYASQKMQQQLKRQQQYKRLSKQKDTGQIDQQYYQMIKAKLDLLGQV